MPPRKSRQSRWLLDEDEAAAEASTRTKAEEEQEFFSKLPLTQALRPVQLPLESASMFAANEEPPIHNVFGRPNTLILVQLPALPPLVTANRSYVAKDALWRLCLLPEGHMGEIVVHASGRAELALNAEEGKPQVQLNVHAGCRTSAHLDAAVAIHDGGRNISEIMMLGAVVDKLICSTLHTAQ